MEELFSCISCQLDFSAQSVCMLRPCHHYMCYGCSSERHFDRGASPFKCGCGVVPIEYGTARIFRGAASTRKWHNNPIAPCITILPPPLPPSPPPLDPVIDKFRLYLQKLKQVGEQARKDIIGNGLFFNILYTVNPIAPSKKEVQLAECSFSLLTDGDSLPSDKDFRAIMRTATLLHKPFMKLSELTWRDEKGYDNDDAYLLRGSDNSDCGMDLDSNGDEEDNDGYSSEISEAAGFFGDVVDKLKTPLKQPYLPPNELLNKITSSEIRILPRFLFSLLSGMIEYNHIPIGDPYNQSKIFASSVASDIVLRAVNPLQLGESTKLSNHLIEHSTASETRDFFSRARITSSRSHHGKDQARDVLKKISKGMKLEPHDLFFMTADNLELQNITERSYEHWTTVLYHVVKCETLDSIGAFDANRKVEDLREILDSKEKTVEELQQEVFLPYQDDYTTLGTAYGVELCLALSWYDNLPTLNECKRRVCALDFVWEKGLPYLYRYSKVEELPINLQAFENLRDISRKASKHDDSTDKKQTIWRRNEIKPGLALKENFSKTGIIMGLRSHANRVGESQMEEYAETLRKLDSNDHRSETSSWPSYKKKKPISASHRFFCWDGSPAYENCKISSKEFDSGTGDSIISIMGPFHLFADDFKATNKQLEEFLYPLLGPMYNNDLKKLHTRFLHFKDPTKPTNHLSSLLLAIDTHIIRCMKAIGIESISAIDIMDYIKTEAKECPLALAFYILRVHYVITLNYYKIPRDDNPDDLMTFMRFSLMKYATTHSTHYMRLCSDELERWYCRSDCLDIILRHMFTSKSENGVNITKDIVHEKYQRAIRTIVGAQQKLGSDYTVEWAALHATDEASNRQSMERLRVGAYTTENRTKMFDFDCEVFARTIVALDKLNVFRRNTKVTVAGKTYNNDKLHSPHSGKALSTDLLSFPTIALDCASKYVTQFNLRSSRVNHRSEKDMGIGPFSTTTIGLAGERKKTTDRVTSVSFEVLKSSGTKVELIAELDRLRRYDVDLPTVNKELSKDVIVRELLAFRKKIFRRNPSAREDLLDEALKSLPKTNTTVEERTMSVDHSYLSFTKKVRDVPVFNKRFNINR